MEVLEQKVGHDAYDYALKVLRGGKDSELFKTVFSNEGFALLLAKLGADDLRDEIRIRYGIAMKDGNKEAYVREFLEKATGQNDQKATAGMIVTLYGRELPADLVQALKNLQSKGGRRRKMSRKYCKKTPCRKMGFTQKASCRPYKNCFTRKARR